MKEKLTGEGGRIAGVIIAVSIVLLAAVMPALVSKIIPAYEHTCLGWRPLVVRTNSMEGVIRKNALIIVFAARWESLKVDDIITFERPDGQLDTHRIIAQDGAHIVTKGDNASAPDTGWVTPDSYKYKVVFTWNWAAWLSDHRGAAYLICLPFLLVGLVTAAVVIFWLVKGRGKQQPAYRAFPVVQMEKTPPEDMPPNGTHAAIGIQAAVEEEIYLDEVISLLEPLLVPPQGESRNEKEKPHEPETRPARALPAVDGGSDSDLDWDDWAFLQLRQPAASPGDALLTVG